MFSAPPARYRLYTSPGRYAQALRDIAAGRLVVDDDVERFEAAVARRFGLAHGLATSQCRVGIYLALKALLRPGQKVVLSPYTIADVVNMVLAAGGRPVFADVERDTCNIDPAEVERLIDGETGAVLATHLHGLAAPIEELAAICAARGVPLIEDCAQAFGARVGGRAVGSFGRCAVVSFGLYKNITTFYGGMVLTDDAELRARMAALQADWAPQDAPPLLKKIASGVASDLATSPLAFKALVYRVFRFGFLNDVRAINRRVEIELDLRRHDELPERYRRRFTGAQARLGLAQLDAVDEHTLVRVRYARRYHEGLAGTPGLRLAPLREDGSHIYTYFPVQYADRRALLQWLMRHRRDVAAQHLKNCADLPAFREFARECPAAREVAGSVVLLPTYPRYGQAAVDDNVRCIGAFFAGSPAPAPAPVAVGV